MWHKCVYQSFVRAAKLHSNQLFLHKWLHLILIFPTFRANYFSVSLSWNFCFCFCLWYVYINLRELCKMREIFRLLIIVDNGSTNVLQYLRCWRWMWPFVFLDARNPSPMKLIYVEYSLENLYNRAKIIFLRRKVREDVNVLQSFYTF